MSENLPAPGLLARARLLAAPTVDASVVRDLERITGRPAEQGFSGAPPEEPFICVGATLPDVLRGGPLVWFHSVNSRHGRPAQRRTVAVRGTAHPDGGPDG